MQKKLLLTISMIMLFLSSQGWGENINVSELKSHNGIVYRKGYVMPFTGNSIQRYPNGNIKEKKVFKYGRFTGNYISWYENGQIESEVVYNDNGEMVMQRLWKPNGELRFFQKYRDGFPIEPVKMTREEAIDVCEKGSFYGYDDWKLPSVKELYAIPYTKQNRKKIWGRTYATSDPMKKHKNYGEWKVSFVNFSERKFRGENVDDRWSRDDLSYRSKMHVLCIRRSDPKTFHLVVGIRQKPDLQTRSESIDYFIHEKKKRAVSSPMPETHEHGYYINVYAYRKYPPSRQYLERITKYGYTYTYHKTATLTKVYIGPFKNKASARKALKTVREKIEKEAYIIKF